MRETQFIREHIYRNARGENVAVKKIFRMPDGKKICYWDTILKNEQVKNRLTENAKAQIPLYLLEYFPHRLEESMGRAPLFFVEGEKDAETLNRLGFIASTDRGGLKFFRNGLKLKNL